MTSASASAQLKWDDTTHEFEVERLYTKNAQQHSDVHGHYLNFGLWEEGNRDYVRAAEAMVHRLAMMLELQPGHRLLDVACGWGAQDFYLQGEFGPLQIDAVDVTWPHIRWATRAARGRKLDRTLRFRHGSATALPFASATFDRLLCIEGSVHFNTRASFLEEAIRVLKPGGRIAIADYIVKNRPKTRLERWVLDTTVSLWKIPAENVTDSAGYAECMRGAGFRNVSLHGVGEKTMPGYYREQARLNFRLHKIRTQGFVVGGLGFALDLACFQAYRMGLIDYVLVSGRK